MRLPQSGLHKNLENNLLKLTTEKRRLRENEDMNRCLTLVISLPERIDRRGHVQENFRRIGHKFLFVDGNRPTDLPTHMQNSAIAIWSSHVLALEKFLETGNEYALILEDDVSLQDKEIERLFINLDKLASLLSDRFSILQLGTMDFTNKSRTRSAISRLYFTFFSHHRYDKSDLTAMRELLGPSEFKTMRDNLSKILGVSCFPLLGFKIGAQSYIINRSAAEWIVRDFKLREVWDLSSRFSIDTLLEEMGHSVDLGPITFRVSRQLLAQRKTPSDNNYYELRIEP
jgi:GR25 family glycosyltransferase involved in LPS biosynthesis